MPLFGPNWGTLLIEWIRKAYIFSASSVGDRPHGSHADEAIEIIAKLSGHDVSIIEGFDYGIVKPKYDIPTDLSEDYTNFPRTVNPKEILRALEDLGPGILYPLAHLATLNSETEGRLAATRILIPTKISLHYIGVRTVATLFPILRKPGFDAQFGLLLSKNRYLRERRGWVDWASKYCLEIVCDVLAEVVRGLEKASWGLGSTTYWQGSNITSPGNKHKWQLQDELKLACASCIPDCSKDYYFWSVVWSHSTEEQDSFERRIQELRQGFYPPFNQVLVDKMNTSYYKNKWEEYLSEPDEYLGLDPKTFQIINELRSAVSNLISILPKNQYEEIVNQAEYIGKKLKNIREE